MSNYSEMKLEQIEQDIKAVRARLEYFDREGAVAFKRIGRRFLVLEVMLIIGFTLVLLLK